MTSIKLRLYAYALNISAERRDTLIELGDRLASSFSEKCNQEQIAQFVMAEASNADEAGFICHAFDVALLRRFKSPYRARAVIYTWLRLRCREIALKRQRFATAWSRVTNSAQIVEAFSEFESAHPEPLEATLLPAPPDVIWNAIKEQAEAYKELRDMDPEAFASSGFDANVKRLTSLLLRLRELQGHHD
jgi:hypothetical protein